MPSAQCMPGERLCWCRSCSRERPYRREGETWTCTWCLQPAAAVTPEKQDENMREYKAQVRATYEAFRASRAGDTREVKRYAILKRKADGSHTVTYRVSLDPPAGRQVCAGCGRLVRSHKWMPSSGTDVLTAICSRCDAPW